MTNEMNTAKICSELVRYSDTVHGGASRAMRSAEHALLSAERRLVAKDDAMSVMEAEAAAMSDALKRIAEAMGLGICHTAEEMVAAVVALQPIKASPAQGEWIEWQGCPIPDGVMHQVKFQNGDVSDIDSVASGWRWGSECADDDIVAYRVLA